MAFDWSTGAAGFKPEATSKFQNGFDTLPDGLYNFEIESVEERPNPKGGCILELSLIVLGGAHDGHKGKRPTFIKDQDGINRWGADLQKLGFAVETWPAGEPAKFQSLMEKALSCLPKMRFHGKKETKDKFLNIYINDRGKDDGKPAVIGPAQMDEILAKLDF